MTQQRQHADELIVGLVSISDRAAGGVYEDKGLPGLREWQALAENVSHAAPESSFRIDE